MDLPASIPWSELLKMAACRDVWRVRARAMLDSLSVTPAASADPPSVTAITATSTVARTNHQNTHSDSPMAKRYIARDVHETFFRPLSKSHRKRKQVQQRKYMTKKRKKKSKPLTDKQRAAAAREHYELHHTTWMPTILGHHHHNPTSSVNPTPLPQTNPLNNTLLPPVHYVEMINYIDNLPRDRQNLQQLP